MSSIQRFSSNPSEFERFLEASRRADEQVRLERETDLEDFCADLIEEDFWWDEEERHELF